MSKVLMGVDIGTGSTKGVITDTKGTVLAEAKVSHSMSLPKTNWAEMDAEQDWWNDFVSVVKDLLGQLENLSKEGSGEFDLAGLSVSGLGPCLLSTDKDFNPVHNAILYGIDMRSTKEIEEINNLLGEEKILEVCGKELSTQAIGPKLLWLQKNEPNFSPENPWFSAHNFIGARLTGRWVVDHHTASQCDPLYDVNRQDWNREWAQKVVPGLALPDLVWANEIIGEVHENAAQLTGLPQGLPVISGTIDAWAEAFSVGVRSPGDLMLMYGSTMFMIQILPAPSVAAGLWTTSGIEAGSHTLSGGMATSGSLTQWIADLTGTTDFSALVDEAKNISAGSDGLVVLPYFAGERAPIFDPDARGIIAGLTLRHSRGHIFRAAYEGIAFGIRQITEMLGDVAGPPARIVAVGGGTQGGLWTQIVADVCGVKQYVPKVTIGASYGDALLAAIGTSLVEPDTDWTEIDFVIEPDTSNTDLYQELFEVYSNMYVKTKEDVHRLADLQK